MPCRDFEEELSAYLDGELPEPEKARVAEHLESCQSCRCRANQLMELITVTKGLSSPAVREGFTDEIMQGISARELSAPKAFSALKYVQQLISLLFMKPAFYYVVMICLIGRFFLSPAQDSRGDYIALSDTAFQKALAQRAVDPDSLIRGDGSAAWPGRTENRRYKEEHFDVHKKDLPLRLAVRRIFRTDRAGDAGPVFLRDNAKHL